LGLLAVGKKIFDEKRYDFLTIFHIGWFLILGWLFSGMGAFLVFVDNKTDLGVMALSIVAVMMAFLMIAALLEQDKKA